MGTYYLLGCHDCKKHYQIAKSFAGREPHPEWDTDEKLLRFLSEHEGHHLEYGTDSVDELVMMEEVRYSE